jgi:hypothetical protein
LRCAEDSCACSVGFSDLLHATPCRFVNGH